MDATQIERIRRQARAHDLPELNEVYDLSLERALRILQDPPASPIHSLDLWRGPVDGLHTTPDFVRTGYEALGERTRVVVYGPPRWIRDVLAADDIRVFANFFGITVISSEDGEILSPADFGVIDVRHVKPGLTPSFSLMNDLNEVPLGDAGSGAAMMKAAVGGTGLVAFLTPNSRSGPPSFHLISLVIGNFVHDDASMACLVTQDEARHMTSSDVVLQDLGTPRLVETRVHTPRHQANDLAWYHTGLTVLRFDHVTSCPLVWRLTRMQDSRGFIDKRFVTSFTDFLPRVPRVSFYQ